MVNKMTMEEIKKQFENKSFFIRCQFIETYNFQDKYFNYYKEYIINFSYKTKYYNYISDLIDLASDLEIYDDILYEKYLSFLCEKFHPVVKLSVISYCIFRYEKYPDIDIEQKLLKGINKQRSIIVKNQIFFSLLNLIKSKEEYYLDLLLKSLETTTEWRSIYRILYSIKNNTVLSKIDKILIAKIENLHNERKFGQGITELLEQLTSQIAQGLSTTNGRAGALL